MAGKITEDEKKKKKKKTMRYPNGYGGIVLLSGRRRNPYWVRITASIEKDEFGKIVKQNYKTVGYYADKAAAAAALKDYHDNPDIINAASTTFAEVYELWFAEKQKKNLDRSTINAYKNSYSVCGSIKDMRMADIKTAHLQKVVAESNKKHPMLRKLQSFLSGVYEYALSNDIVNKDYSAFIDIGRPGEKTTVRVPFTEEQIKKLWDNLGNYEYLDTVLIQIYTGMRIGELLKITNDNVHLDEKYMVGGSKTEAGKDRIIPLHDKIVPLIKNRHAENSNHLILQNGAQITYDNYLSTKWTPMMDGLEMNKETKHLPHDCRHTFSTLANTYGMNKLAHKRIMGHATSDVTDMYTHKFIEELLKEVNKLP